MLSTALIVFREVLEASLIVSIVLAASKGVAGRGWWVAGGLVCGIVGAGLLAIFADALSNLASGLGQELFNAAVMFVAVVMLAWHSIWMSSHSREMARQISAVGKAVATGSKPLIGLSVVVGAAVLREGAEAVLFLYGVLVSSPGETLQMLVGGLIGLVGGVSLGFGMYAGLLQIPIKKLFAVTNALIVLLAAGMASQCVGFLISAGVAPTWGDVVWDSSWLLDETSIAGKMLHALVGYTARPAGSQIVVYLLTFGVIVGLSKIASTRQHTS
ncbi:transport related, membrane protein [Caballeronia calidae]|uniref:Transport related, membrane protein n=1 Tax=Caballeronia calidae TaxID=1777139 RepID=A0A158CTN7_9BURK|nr:FTR1 family protein [Caballeronia calidae]SAK85674.1 transport related, membrane protein [Caballeronia calidae]